MAFDLPPPPSLSALRAHRNLGVFVDFDGTLVDLATTPGTIQIDPSLKSDLETVAKSLDDRLALVTGRSIEDLCHYLGPIRVHIAGSHGAEIRSGSGENLARSARPVGLPVREVQELAAKHPRLLIEQKSMGLAIHYRNAKETETEVLDFAADLTAGRSLQLKYGKFVVEFVAPGTDKGVAVDLLMQDPKFKGALPVFVGDDVTDEDGFAVVRRYGGLAIAVGDRFTRSAHYRLQNPCEVRRWLFAKD